MGIYVFSTGPLLEYLKKNQRKASNDFGKDVLPDMVESREALAYPFLGPDGQSAYWRDVGDLPAYQNVNEEFVNGQYKSLGFDGMPGPAYQPCKSMNNNMEIANAALK